jgi:hypothetical protein
LGIPKKTCIRPAGAKLEFNNENFQKEDLGKKTKPLVQFLFSQEIRRFNNTKPIPSNYTEEDSNSSRIKDNYSLQ